MTKTEKRTIRRTIRLTEQEDNELSDIAAKLGEDMSDTIRLLLREAIEHRRTMATPVSDKPKQRRQPKLPAIPMP